MLPVYASHPRRCTLHPTANLAVVAIALLLDAAFGYPETLFRAIRHPVVWIGTLLGWLDQRLNRDGALGRRGRGIVALALLLAAAILPAAALQWAAPAWGTLLLALPAASLIAQRSLWAHVVAVADALDETGTEGGLRGGRRAVSHIVGRDPDTLDEAGVARAAIESLAENFSDGVVAPALWCAVLGLPGIVAYKAINTADSMIGHRTPRHAAFGWAAARLDDWVNLPASRTAALWLIAAAALHPRADAARAVGTVRRDAANHRSPNAGWPEAAMAGALGLRLAGPRVYGAMHVHDAWMGDGRAEATTQDLRLALSLYRLACGLQITAASVAAMALTLTVRG